jgi:ATP-dependent RNA helicase DOB1
MMMRSFLQFQREHRRPQLEAQIAKLEGERDALPVSEEQAEIFEEYIAIQDQLEVMRRSQRDLCNQPRFVKGFLAHGRAVRVVRRSDQVDFGWGIVIGTPRASLPTASEEDPAQWLVDVAVIVGKAQLSSGTGTATPVAINDFASDTAELVPLPFTFADIATISSRKINLPQRLDDALKLQVVRALALKLAASEGALKAMTPQELGVTEEQCAPYAQVAQRVATLERQLARNEVAAAQAAAETDVAAKELLGAFEHFRARQEKDKEISAMRNDLRAMQRTILTEDLKKMMRVMRRMDYIDGNNVLMRKGRVACEITTSDENEILLTELLFRGTLKDMETEMIVALLSCLVNVHRTPDNFALPEEFRAPLQDLKDIVKRIATVSIESGLTGIVLEDEAATAGAAGAASTGPAAGGKSGGRKKTSYVDEKVLPSLMEATYRWAKGAKFVDVMGSTDAYEGDVVRMMRRLEELLRQMAGAARSPAVGSMELHDRFMAGIQMIKRDIIFASSLYL